MMTKSKAIKKAQRLAKRNGYDYFVVRSQPDWHSEYEVVREDELDGFYFGCPIIACVEPSTHVHY